MSLKDLITGDFSGIMLENMYQEKCHRLLQTWSYKGVVDQQESAFVVETFFRITISMTFLMFLLVGQLPPVGGSILSKRGFLERGRRGGAWDGRDT